MLSTNICKNCKYFQPDKSWYIRQYRIANGKCTHPTSQTIDIVSGDVTYETAKEMRKTQCGPQGSYYIVKKWW